MTDVGDQRAAASIEVARWDGVHTVVLRGELDLACSPGIEARIESFFASGPVAMLLDLSRLTFMDAAGVKLILLIKERAESIGCPLAVVPGPANVQRIFDLAGLSMALPWVHHDFVGAN